MRVLIITDNLSYDTGVTAIVMNLYRNIDKSLVQCDFLVCNETKTSCKKEIESLGGKVFYVGNPLSVKTLFSSLKNIKDFFKNNASKYNAVHLHSPTLALFTLKYAKKNGINNRIVHSHSTMMSTSKLKTIVNNYLIKKIKKYANNYWACSTEAAYFLYGEKFCKTHEIILVKNAVDISKFIYNQQESNKILEKYKLANKIIITHISNFSVIKNHIFLTDVIEKVISNNKNVKFLFVGDGPTKKDFEAILEKKGLINYCLFIGRVSNVNAYLQISDVVILPSLKEGLPVTIVEAQAAGIPCIISNTITKEVNTGIVKYAKLEVDDWVDLLKNIKKLSIREKNENKEKFLSSPFNIEIEAKKVQKLYLELESHYEKK